MTACCARSIRSVITIIYLVFGAAAFAQDPEDAVPVAKSEDAEPSDRDIEEVIVIGSRRSELLQEVGLAISTVEPEKLVTAGLVTLGDALDYTAGVNLPGGGNWGQGTVFMRAVTQESATPVTAIYIDDVPLTPEVPYAFAQIRFFDGMLGDIERVEVIKGPQGTLYGAGAVGGVVRYVTRDPSLEKASGRLAIDVSNTAHGEWNQRYKLYGSIPIVKDQLAIAVTGIYADQGGYLDRIDPASGSIEQDINPFDLSAGSLTGLWRITTNASLKFLASRYSSDSEQYASVNYDYPSFVPTYGFYVTDEPPSPGTITFYTYAATLSIDFDRASLTYVSALAGYDEVSGFDATALFGELTDNLVGAVPGTNTTPVTIDLGADKRTQELRLISNDNRSLEWQTGIYFTDVDTDNFQTVFGVPSNYRLLIADFPSKFRELAVYGNVTWYLRPDLDITLGARHSDVEMSVIFQNAGFLLTGDPDGEITSVGETGDRVMTYLLGARWRPSSESSFYVRVANGYRPAQPSLIVQGETDQQGPDYLAKPDDLWSYEIGAKGTRLDGQLQYDMALWAIDWHDFQATVTVNGISGAGNSDSDISAHGFEATLRYRPTDDLEIDGSIGYADSSLDNDAPALGGLKGERSRYLPRWTGSLRGVYQFRLTRFDASASAGLRYVGSYPTAYRSGVPGCGCPLNFPVDSYLLMDGSVTLGTERYGLTLYGTNLLDEAALADAGAQDAFTNQAASGSPVRPRTIGVYLWRNF